MDRLTNGRLSYVSAPLTMPYKYDTVITCLEHNARKYPETEFLVRHDVDGNRKKITFAKLLSTCRELAKFLITQGIQPRDVVALFGPNSIEWMIGALAVIMVGGIVFQMSGSTDFEMAYKKTNCKVLILCTTLNTQSLESMIQMTGRFRQKLYYRQNIEKDFDITIFIRESEFIKCHSLFRTVFDVADLKDDFPFLFPEDTILLFETSGSTGIPKLVPRTHFDFVNISHEEGQTIIYNDRPFSWSGGTPFTDMCASRTRVFTASDVALMGKSTEKIWNTIKKEKCTHATLMPYFLADLIQMKTKYTDSFKLKCIRTFGQIVDSECTQVVGTYSDGLVIEYGSTEDWYVCETHPMALGDIIRTGYVGNAKPGVEMKVIDDTLRVTKRGDSGEICVRSSLLFRGYYLSEEETKAAFLPGKWYRTGDRGSKDKNGCIYIEGRFKEVISRGTRKIMPAAVEDSILRMCSLLHVVVVAVPDKRLQEELCACFMTKTGVGATARDVEEYCKIKMMKTLTLDGLGEIPTYYLKFNNFPFLLNGKPDRKKIKSIAIARLGLWWLNMQCHEKTGNVRLS